MLSVQITGVVGYCAGPRSRASVAESMTKPRQPNDAGLTVPCQVHALAPIRCRRPVDNSVQNCGARTKAQGFHRSRVRLCEIGSIKCARKMQALAKNTAATTNSTVELILASPRWLRRHKNRVGFRIVPWFRGFLAEDPRRSLARDLGPALSVMQYCFFLNDIN